MASGCNYNIVNYKSEDEEFNQILSHVGGRGNVYLVGDIMDSESKYSILQEFISDVFGNDDAHREITCAVTDISNGNVRSGLTCKNTVSDDLSDRRHNCSMSKDQCSSESGVTQKEGDLSHNPARVKTRIIQTSGNISAKGRTISCSVIIFIFRHVCFHNKGNHVYLEEILKDVKTRTKRNGVRPALIGLIYSDVESAESRDSVMYLEQTLRSVFTKHPHESIWAGHFISKAPEGMHTIKRHICTAVHFSQSPDNMQGKQGCISLPLRRWFRGEHQPNTTPNSLVQKGNPESTEGIPLQMRS